MKTNELKKGTEVKLRNGWKAELMDNMKGNTRIAKVYGTFTECGSIYSHDIISAIVDGKLITVEHTDAQLRLKKQTDMFF